MTKKIGCGEWYDNDQYRCIGGNGDGWDVLCPKCKAKYHSQAEQTDSKNQDSESVIYSKAPLGVLSEDERDNLLGQGYFPWDLTIRTEQAVLKKVIEKIQKYKIDADKDNVSAEITFTIERFNSIFDLLEQELRGRK